MLTPVERHKRATIAAKRRHHPNDPKTEELAREFKADRLAQYIQKVVDEAPPLSAEQRGRLALLLQNPGGAS